MKSLDIFPHYECVYTSLVEPHNECFEYLAALQRKRTFEGKENHVPDLGDLESSEESFHTSNLMFSQRPSNLKVLRNCLFQICEM